MPANSQNCSKSSHQQPRGLFRALRCALSFFTLLLVLHSFSPGTAVAQNSGTISGKVINGTTDQPAPGLEIKLDRYQGAQLTGSLTTMTSADGEFRFPNLDTQSTNMYLVTTVYKDVTYHSTGLVFQADQSVLTVELVVFDPGATAEAIFSKIAHTILYGQGGSLSVLEFQSLVNPTNKVFVPAAGKGEKNTIQLFLPKEADAVNFITGLTPGNSSRSENGLAYTSPVKPGETEFAYSYQIPNAGSQYIYFRPVFYPMTSYSLLVQGNALQVESSLLQRQEPVVINNQPFQRFSAQELGPGTNVIINISQTGAPELAAPGVPAPSTAGSRIIFIVFPAILVLALLGFLLWKRKPVPVKVRPSRDSRAEDQLLQDLAMLDDKFESGEIEEEAYVKLRAEKKAELLKQLQSSSQ